MGCRCDEVTPEDLLALGLVSPPDVAGRGRAANLRPRPGHGVPQTGARAASQVADGGAHGGHLPSGDRPGGGGPSANRLPGRRLTRGIRITAGARLTAATRLTAGARFTTSAHGQPGCSAVPGRAAPGRAPGRAGAVARPGLLAGPPGRPG